MAERKHLLHVKSNQPNSESNGPKLPTPEQLEYGEIAINYLKDNEKLSIKNSSNEIVTIGTDKQNQAKFDVLATGINKISEECGFDESMNYDPQNELITGATSVSNAIDIVSDNVKILQSLNKYKYQELYNLYTNKQLVPNALYAITDYKCAYWHPATGSESSFEMEQEAPDVEFIILKAIDIDKFDDRVSYIRKEGYSKIIDCKYSIDPELVGFTKGMTTYHPTGAVYYMKDDADNECDYDFKHVKFRRYAITDITANTRGDNGTGGIAGPFRTFMEKTGTSYKWSDDRQRVGAGCESEKEFVQDIFNGTWYGKGEWAVDYGTNGVLKPFHEDYILKILKPYKDTSLPNDKYLAWQKDMYASKGLSEKWSAGTCQVEGMCNVSVDGEDYIDRYTFDYNGTDASERYTAGAESKIKLICGCSIMQDTKNTLDEILHNTVLIISESGINYFNTALMGVKIGGRILGGGNTLLFRPGFLPYTQAMNVKIIGSPTAPFRGNLIIASVMLNCYIMGCGSNYFNGHFANFNVSSYIENNVFIGSYQNMEIKVCTKNLFYGADIYVKCEGDTSAKSYPDGTTFYSMTIKDNCYSNIIGAMQFSNFEPHVNSNTFRAPYNKACEIYGFTSFNSFGSTRWGVKINYQGSGHGYKFGQIVRSSICSCCFSYATKKNASGAEYADEENKTVIGLNNVDVYGNYRDASKTNDLPEAAKNAIGKLSVGTLRYMLVHDSSGTWHVFDYMRNEITD